MTVGGQRWKEGDFISINATVSHVYQGEIKAAASEILPGFIEKSLDGRTSDKFRMFKTLMDWCYKVTRFQVRTNADTPEQTENAIAFGATGIGLCRTEHMFFAGDRIDAMREVILDDIVADLKKALARILPYQENDFVGIFKALNGCPNTIRFLDPPLHEFLPHDHESQNKRRKNSVCPRTRFASASRNCASSTQCSDSAVAASAWFIPRSARCRPGPCWKRPRKCRRPASR